MQAVYPNPADRASGNCHAQDLSTTFLLRAFSLTIPLVAACSREEPAPPPAREVRTPAATDVRGNAAPAPPAQIDVSRVKKAEGGVTVEELFAGKANLSGKEIVLRGKVVKFNPQIMGKNWLHVHDGSGDANAHTNDLTITTDVPAKVGDTVLVKGKVILDKDFGYGYKYDVIIEDAKVTVE